MCYTCHWRTECTWCFTANRVMMHSMQHYVLHMSLTYGMYVVFHCQPCSDAFHATVCATLCHWRTEGTWCFTANRVMVHSMQHYMLHMSLTYGRYVVFHCQPCNGALYATLCATHVIDVRKVRGVSLPTV